MQNRIIYVDNAATTPLSKEAFEAMKPWLTEKWGNPSSIYSIARDSRRAIEKAREDVAAAIGAKPEEIYFTSGGTESDNWAIKSSAKAFAKKGRHMISSSSTMLRIDGITEIGRLRSDGPSGRRHGWSIRGSEKAISRHDTYLYDSQKRNGTIQPIPNWLIARKHKILSTPTQSRR